MKISINNVELDYTVTSMGVLFIHHAYLEFKLRGNGCFKEALNKIQEMHKLPIELESFHTLVPMYEHLGFKDMDETDDQGYHLMRRDYENL
jgi:predicted GNAT family N-acyltransferase